MKYKKILKVFLVVFLLATLVYVFSGIKGKGQTEVIEEANADGQGMVFSCFNKDNKKAMELKCSESIRESNDKTIMKNVQGNIFKKGRMNKDIKVFGDEGFVENNFYNFFVEKNARLASEDFIVWSDNFTLKDRAELYSAPHVSYQTETLKGNAENGMGFYLNVNVLKFFNTKGSYKRDDRTFNYEAGVLWIIDESKIIVLEKDVVIKDDRSILESDWLTIRLDKDMKRVKEASSQKNSYFYMKDPETLESKEIKAQNISTLYDDQAHLTRITVMQQARVLMKGEERRTLVSGDIIEMNFDGPTGKATSLKIPVRGIVENKGKTRFRVVADAIDAKYNNAGEISYCEGNGNVEFIIDEYRGTSAKMSYDIEKDSITLEGEGSRIIHKTNTFTSSQFRVKVKDKQLYSNRGVKSLILVEKESALFSLDPIYINAVEITILEKEKKFKYRQQVNLTQGETQLSAYTLSISEDSSVLAEGRVSLAFKKSEKDIAVQGGKLTFDPAKEEISIVDSAVIKSGETILRSAAFQLLFNERKEVDRIRGEEDIYFVKDDLSGKSRRADWLFSREVLILKGGPPEIVNQNGGKTTGKELRVNLRDNRITIISDESDRTQTIIRQ